jgi:hypothetical protein
VNQTNELPGTCYTENKASVWSENVHEKCTSHLILIHLKSFTHTQNNYIGKENCIIISHGTILLFVFVVYKPLIMKLDLILSISRLKIP